MQQSGIMKTLQAAEISGHVEEQVVHHGSLC